MKNSLIIVLLIMLTGTGCSLSTGRNLKHGYDRLPPIEPFQEKATNFEKKEDLQLALANWRVAEKLIVEKINTLTEHIENKAEKHFQKGLTLFNSGFVDLAVMEFVKTLSYDREHKEALSYLKKRAGISRSRLYEVQPGDTVESVAKKVYKNSDMAYLIQLFSGNGASSDTLAEGQTMMLPELELEFTKLFFNLKKELTLARKEFKNKAYETVLAHAETILRHDPEHNEALYMKNTACFRLGEKYFHDEKYQQAINLLKRVDRNYRNVKNDIAEVKDAFTKKKNETVEYENNKRYHEGLKLYESKRYQEALTVFSKIVPEYANVDKIVAKIKTEMKDAAALYYKNGVKHFVNEELVLAVQEWKKALQLDPANSKISKDIENAMNLLEKNPADELILTNKETFQ